MVHTPRQGLQDSLHFQGEEEGGEATDVDIRFHADKIDLEVVTFRENVDDKLLLWR